MNTSADEDPETLRLSIDTKATVLVGQYSRGGKSRGTKAVEAWDHDMRPREKLVPVVFLNLLAANHSCFLVAATRPVTFWLMDLSCGGKRGSPLFLTSNNWSLIWIMVRNAMGVGVNFCTG